MVDTSVTCALLAAMVAKHRWGTPIGEDALLALSAIGDAYPTAREAYADLRTRSFISYRGQRGIALDPGRFGDLADFLYHECGWPAWEIRTRLKHYEGVDDHDWASGDSSE